jgi:hypothetical protein
MRCTMHLGLSIGAEEGAEQTKWGELFASYRSEVCLWACQAARKVELFVSLLSTAKLMGQPRVGLHLLTSSWGLLLLSECHASPMSHIAASTDPTRALDEQSYTV